MARVPLARRRFLQGIVAASAAPLFVPRRVLGAPGRPSANNRINVCAIGFRNQGGGLVRNVRGNASAELVALCDVDKLVLQKKHNEMGAQRGSIKTYTDFREAIARTDIDAVTIATPDHSHACIANYAMRAGKDVYVEKPMAWSIREGRAMVQTAERYGRVLQVGSQHQSEVGLIQMAELARNGRIGEVRAIYNSIACARGGLTGPLNPQPVPPELDYDLWLGPAPYVPYDPKRTHYNWRFAREFGTGEMGNWGGHSFAAINLVLGTEDTSPVEVRATAAGEAPVCGSWQKFQLEFVFANGVRALINHGPGLKAVGTKGWITRSASEPASVLRSRIGASEIQLRRAVGGHMGDWFDCIRTRQQPTAPARAGHRAATMAHLANICLDLGRPLKYDPVKEEFPGDAQANRKLGRLWRAPWVM